MAVIWILVLWPKADDVSHSSSGDVGRSLQKEFVLVELLLWNMVDVATTYNKVEPLTYMGEVRAL